MRSKFVLLAGLLVLGTSSAIGQAWVNPGTSGGPDCGPFQDQWVGASSWYCYYEGTFPWFDAGGGWITVLRVAAPSSAAVHVKYDFFQLNNGSVDPVALDMTRSGNALQADSSYAFDLSPNQPAEVTLMSKHNDNGPSEASGSVHVEIDCPNQATCFQIMPQLIYTHLPTFHWFLSGALSPNVSLPTAPDSQIWAFTGISYPQSDSSKNQIMSFAIFNDSGADQTYTVVAYDETGTKAGQNTTPTVVAGQSFADTLNHFIPGLPNGLLKVLVTGTGTSVFTALQFNGPAATALLPVAEMTVVP